MQNVIASDTKKDALRRLFSKYGGEGGIRTLDTLPYTRFPGVLLQPLGHLTILFVKLAAQRGANLMSIGLAVKRLH